VLLALLSASAVDHDVGAERAVGIAPPVDPRRARLDELAGVGLARLMLIRGDRAVDLLLLNGGPVQAIV
jgi:hypothetical protein